MAVLGVDGWRGAWVGALLDGRSVTLLALPDVAAVLAVPDVELVAIDMPIGLSEDGARACDVAGPAAAGPRRAARSSRRRCGRCSPRDDYAEARRAVARGHGPAAGAVRAGLPAGEGHPAARRRARRPAVRPGRRGPPRAGLPRARRPACATGRAAPAARSSGCRALRPVMDVEHALAERPGRRPGDRRAGRLRGGLVGAAAGRRRRRVRRRRHARTAAAGRCGSAGDARGWQEVGPTACSSRRHARS